jgi:hypothetical protein
MTKRHINPIKLAPIFLLPAFAVACQGGTTTITPIAGATATPLASSTPAGSGSPGASASPGTTASPGASASPGSGASPTPSTSVAPGASASPGSSPTPTGSASPSASASPNTSTTANPSFITLGAAASYAILAGTTVTAAGPDVVTGNIGIYPGTAITGFPPATDTGTINAGNPAAQAAESASTTAYGAAVARSGAPITISGDQGGVTLTPGLYKSTSSLLIASGNLTLNGNGDQNAVFVFQIASTLTTNSGGGGGIILTNGANAANIFWQVGSSATLNGTPFMGNVMALTSVSIGNGVIMLGRAQCQNGAVSLGTSGSLSVPPATSNGQSFLRF